MTTINWQEVETMTPEQIENLRIECLKELQTIEDNQQIVRQEYLLKSREMIRLEGERKDLQITLSKSSHLIKQKKNDIDLLTTKFWQSRR